MCGSRVCRALAAAALAVCALSCAPLWVRADVISLASEEYASLAGYVYVDLNLSGEMEAGELLISEVVMILEGLSDEGESVLAERSTSQDGAYCFTKIWPGDYFITEVQPIEFLQGPPNQPGTIQGKPAGHPDCGAADGPDKFINIRLNAGDVGIMYNFGEAGLRSAYVSKRHFLTYRPEPEDPQGDIPEPGSATLLSVGALLLLHAFGRQRRRKEADCGRLRGR